MVLSDQALLGSFILYTSKKGASIHLKLPKDFVKLTLTRKELASESIKPLDCTLPP